MILREELTIHKHKIALVGILMMMLCGTFVMMHLHRIWQAPSAFHQNSQYAGMMQAENSLKQIKHEMADLAAFKEQFESSLEKIESWMKNVNPHQKFKQIQKARSAQVSLFDYLTKELKNLDARFKQVPTFADLKKLDEQLLHRQKIIQSLQDLTRNRKAKILFKHS
jgi:hypothetical protein